MDKLENFTADHFKNEKKVLFSLVPESVLKCLEKHNAMVCGGAITSLMTNREVNDLDVYFRSWPELESFLAHMSSSTLRCGRFTLNNKTSGWSDYVKNTMKIFRDLEGKTYDYPELVSSRDLDDGVKAEEIKDHSSIKMIGMTGKSVMFSFGGEVIIQVIAFDVFPDGPQQVFDKFDWTINMGCFDFSDMSWKHDKYFLKHNSQRMLMLNTKTDYPIISLLRVAKYTARGYQISKKEMMKLGIAIGTLKMSSWKDAKSHLSGMYGTNVDKLFDTKDDFSIDGLFDKLEQAENKYISQIATAHEKEIKVFELQDRSLFELIQLLRINTGRKHVDELFGLCGANFFYLIDKAPGKTIHLGMCLDERGEHDDSFFSTPSRSRVELTPSLADALETMKLREINPPRDKAGNKSEGCIVFATKIADPSKLTFDGDNIEAGVGAGVVLTTIIDSVGDFG